MKILRMTDTDLRGKRVLIREDLNVPVQDGAVTSDARIRAALPTIRYALDQNAQVFILSHLGRPKEGRYDEALSLKPVAARLSELLGKPVPLRRDWLDALECAPGSAVLCENVRFNKGEKQDDEPLARRMAALCDVFVMDAFGTAHRAEASTHGVARFARTACAGPLLVGELEALERALQNPARPLVAIVAGSKVSTKLTVLESLLAKVDKLIVGGGIANTFLAASGVSVGKSLCDVFVMDAFGTAHRAEASTHGVVRFARTACAGPLLVGELEALERALQQPARPLVAIVAGSKVSTKLTVLESLLAKVDQLIVGGGIANTFLAATGVSVGKSLCEADLVEVARRLMEQARARGAEIPLPTDVVVAKEFAATAHADVRSIHEVGADEMILDIGPDTADRLSGMLQEAGTILWNGPVGVFEFEQFGEGTRAIARAIARSGAFSLAGGGDTLAAIEKYGVEDGISYISTGGGAFLEFVEGKTLPAVAVLEERANG